MNKAAFKETMKLLEDLGFSPTGEYHNKAFGSWVVEIPSHPPLRVLWDGKDGWLIVERQTDEMFDGKPKWRDLWVAKDPAYQRTDTAVFLISHVTKHGLGLISEPPDASKHLVARGDWFLAEKAGDPIYIVRLNYDFWFELARQGNHPELSDGPRLGKDGFGYYESFHGIGIDGSFWPDSMTYRTITEAKAQIEGGFRWPIEWK